jgi:hypothetical protein
MNIIEKLPESVQFLREEESQRLRSAITVYNQTIKGNAQRLFDSQSPRERMMYALGRYYRMEKFAYRSLIRQYRIDPVNAWWETATSYARMSCAGVYKSALLGRILAGNDPLPFAPPRSYGYPWYELLEAPDPIVLSDVGIYLNSTKRQKEARESIKKSIKNQAALQQDLPQDLRDRGIESIFINQSRYQIIGANRAATDLLCAINQMQQTPDGICTENIVSLVENAPDKEIPIITSNHPLMPAVLEAYKNSPEIIVTHGHWGAWRIFIAPQEVRRIDAKRGAELLQAPLFSKANARGINPMDLIFTGLHAVVFDKADDAHYSKTGCVKSTLDRPADPELDNIMRALSGQNPHACEVQPSRDPNEWGDSWLQVMANPIEPKEKILMQWDVWHIERISETWNSFPNFDQK